MSIEAMKQWLKALEHTSPLIDDVITAKASLSKAIEQAEKQEPVPWQGCDLDGMVEAFERVIEVHFFRKNPFHNPIDADAQMALRILRGFIPYMKQYTTPQPQQAEKQKPVALKNGECWPEYVMEEWDYWRKQIADGDKGSAPRDWFEELAELKLVTAQPQREWVGLNNDDWIRIYNHADKSAGRAAEIAEKILKEKNT